MIRVPVDEASAFDMLAIHYIKARHLARNSHLAVSFQNNVEAVLGVELVSLVVSSTEYAALFKANEAVWDMQEKAMRDTCKASDIDKANQKRYHAKAALQRKFFSTPLTEQKSRRPYKQPQHKEGAD